MELLKKSKELLVGITVGSMQDTYTGIFIGCTSGTCAITSNPLNSTLYGAFMGGLVGSTFKKEQHTKTSSE